MSEDGEVKHLVPDEPGATEPTAGNEPLPAEVGKLSDEAVQAIQGVTPPSVQTTPTIEQPKPLQDPAPAAPKVLTKIGISAIQGNPKP